VSVKKCIRCGIEKPAEQFHKHAQMKDGRINKCKKCVVEYIAEWRERNPGVRAEEYSKGQGAERRARGLRRRPNGLGPNPDKTNRRIASVKYAHKRRVALLNHPVWDNELDDFAFCEARRLCVMRGEMDHGKWELDHVVPINHRKASGLHNAYNFQVVPAKWNNKKMNTNMDWYFPRAGISY
jgi:hypothetical protein